MAKAYGLKTGPRHDPGWVVERLLFVALSMGSSVFHERPPKRRASVAPNPENSRETPQRSRKRWLLSLRPKPGERRRVQSEGKFQAMTGARYCAVSCSPKL